MDGFSELTAEQQAQVLNHAENFQGLPKSMNSSKGGKLPADWTQYRGEPLSPQYIDRSQALQTQLLEELQAMIDGFRGSPGG